MATVRLFKLLAYAAAVAVALAALAAYLFYRSLLPRELPAKAPAMPPMVRAAVLAMLGPHARAGVARFHLDRLEERGALPGAGYQKERLRVAALERWLRRWSDDDVADAYAALVSSGDDHASLVAQNQALFGKPLEQLAAHEAALLMVKVQAPRHYDPACHPDAALEARNALLTRMAGVGDEALAKAKAMPIDVLERCTQPMAERDAGATPRVD